MPTLTELMNQEQLIETEIMAAEGEISQDIELLLQQVLEKKEDKINNYCNFMAHIEDRIDANKKKKDLYAVRQKAYETLLKNIKNYLKTNMQERNIKALESRDFKICLQRTQAVVEIDEAGFFEDKYYIVKKELSKTLIKDALKAGEKIEGAWLKENESLRIKVV